LILLLNRLLLLTHIHASFIRKSRFDLQCMHLAIWPWKT